MYLETAKFKHKIRTCLEFIWPESPSTSNFMLLVSSKTLMRLRKRTYSPESSLIKSVGLGTSSYWVPGMLISCSGPSCVQERAQA